MRASIDDTHRRCDSIFSQLDGSRHALPERVMKEQVLAIGDMRPNEDAALSIRDDKCFW